MLQRVYKAIAISIAILFGYCSIACAKEKEEFVLGLHEPQPMAWDSATVEGMASSGARLKVFAQVHGLNFSELMISLGNSKKYFVPKTLLSNLDVPQLHTLLVLTTPSSDPKELSQLAVFLSFGDPLMKLNQECEPNHSASLFNEAQIVLDFRRNEFTLDTYDPCHNLLSSRRSSWTSTK
jgi:hypothetical protein